MLFGPPGNGKSSLLQALSIRFNLELFFPKVTKTMTVRELSNLLLPNNKECMICLEDAESAFQSTTELEKQQALMEGGGVTGMQQQQKKRAPGRAPRGGRSPPMGMGFGGGGGGGAHEVVTPETFISLLRGDGSSAPNKRLIFFSTNHVSKMPPELVEFVDQQGTRAEFPNCDKPMMESAFDLFFPVVGSREESLQSVDRLDSLGEAPQAAAAAAPDVQRCRAEFVAAVTAAWWFAGFDDSNVSGACLSEYFQRHRDNPERVVRKVSGAAADTLQMIVAKSGAVIPEPADAGGAAPPPECDPKRAKSMLSSPSPSPSPSPAGFDEPFYVFAGKGVASIEGNRIQPAVRGPSAPPLQPEVETAPPASAPAWRPPRFQALRWCVFGLGAAAVLELGVQQHPYAMFMLVFMPTIVNAASVKTWTNVAVTVLAAAMCTLDCDGEIAPGRRHGSPSSPPRAIVPCPRACRARSAHPRRCHALLISLPLRRRWCRLAG